MRKAYLLEWKKKNGSAADRRYYSKNKERRREYMARWRKGNPDKVATARARYVMPVDVKARHRERSRRDVVEMRVKIIIRYGSKCVCCGEAESTFLTIDHVAGGGSRERASGITAPVLYRRIIKAGFPSVYRLLCWNCNAGVGLHGRCPHPGGVMRGVCHGEVYEKEQDTLFDPRSV